MLEILAILFNNIQVPNLAALSLVNRDIHRASKDWIQDYYHSHTLRYFGKKGIRKKIRVVIHGKRWINGKPKENSTWHIEIFKGERVGLITIHVLDSVQSVKLDLTARRRTRSERTNGLQNIDPWIVQPLCFDRQNVNDQLHDKLCGLTDPNVAKWYFADRRLYDVRKPTLCPRFLRVACGLLKMDFHFWDWSRVSYEMAKPPLPLAVAFFPDGFINYPGKRSWPGMQP